MKWLGLNIVFVLLITLLSAQCVFADSKYLDVRNASNNSNGALGYFDSDEVKEGVSAFEAGNYTKALEILIPAAKAGNAYGQYFLGAYYGYVEAQYENAVIWYRKSAAQGYAIAKNDLADCFFHGNGVKQNYYEAFELFKAAADQGLPIAMDNLVVCYYNGFGTERNLTEAITWNYLSVEQGSETAKQVQSQLNEEYKAELNSNGSGLSTVETLKGEGDKAMYNKKYSDAVSYYKQAADQGYAPAQNQLGWCYEKGYGVQQNYTEAAKWYKKAADQGYALSQANLGWFYEEGNGVIQDYTSAAAWYRKAAERGNATAQNNLALLYEYGKGVEQDYDEAVKWFELAAAKGDQAAATNLAYLLSKM